MENLERAVTDAVSKQLFFDRRSVDIDSAVQILVEHLTNISHGMRVTFFFPDHTELKPVTVYGVPPEEGKKVYVKPLEMLPTDPREAYQEYDCWTVLEVTYSVIPATKTEHILNMVIHGKEPNWYEAQVKLGKARRWTDMFRRKTLN